MQYKVLKEWQLIEPVVSSMGYELVAIERLRQAKHETLRVYIDKPEGINVDDCAAVSHQLSGVLDVEELISRAYDLEISSPGLNRPLFKMEDFQRFTGQDTKIRLIMPLDGRRNFKGTIIGVEGNNVLVQVDQQRFELPFDQIEQARLVPEINF